MVSNRNLAFLIIAAVVISLGGTLISLDRLDKLPIPGTGQQKGFTGLATGQLNLSISSNAACHIDTNVSFGTSGQPAATYSLTTEKNNSAGGLTTFEDCTEQAGADNCKGLQINNTGNVNINVSFASDSNASTLLVSQLNLDATDFRYFVVNGSNIGNASNGCLNLTNLTAQIERLPLNVVQAANQMICANLSYTDGTDVMHMEFNITIEPDIYPSTKTAVITITCETV